MTGVAPAAEGGSPGITMGAFMVATLSRQACHRQPRPVQPTWSALDVLAGGAKLDPCNASMTS